ncbi:MAG TPA: prolipoprotein diacylglyceryl transferase family protein, partial [Solirubrobacteraceae bacterium]|nr:prolipoprotein diacylglyceryl transferase family protein [Solirubrobacteraceae bacterium]
GLIGARGYYVIQNYSEVKHHVFHAVFSGSGLVWYGGAIGGAIGILTWAHVRKVLDWPTLDMAATVLALGYAIGRIGCQVSGDGDYGMRAHGLDTMAYPHGTVPTPAGVTVYPTPIYETVTMGLLALLLWSLRDRVRPGVVFALYFVLSGVERLLVEFIRRNHEVWIGLTAAQLESIGSALGGLLLLAWLTRREGSLSPLPLAESASGA